MTEGVKDDGGVIKLKKNKNCHARTPYCLPRTPYCLPRTPYCHHCHPRTCSEDLSRTHVKAVYSLNLPNQGCAVRPN